ncbi:isoleucyl-tRNA synthetase [Auriscalpium vulgare]|uniref:Isoleucyl-tRNA synthetase n=1 Tax=Auriscalpium vulgare TaxID=40419 RepID=A0ACB8SAG7_9AGAM|nr:isoleucyl-tRNA synthetase [Auriscalpium vulgare]
MHSRPALLHASAALDLLTGPCARRLFSSPLGRRASSADAEQNKRFSKTVLLPRTTFPQWTDASKTEAMLRRKTCDDLYRWQRDGATGLPFVLHDGPPYANGDLHMGHALNKILKDIINRYHLSLGHRVHYVPGWDCHGLPIENKALQGHDHGSLSAAKIRSLANDTAASAVQGQKQVFRELGIMADWDNEEGTYRTLDHDYEMRQLRVFQKMVERGLIYRHYRPVHYSPSSRSALAEAELVYKDDHVSHSVYIAFDLAMSADGTSAPLRALIADQKRVRLLAWTTTPWSLTANMGIAVHPEMAYALVRQLDKPHDSVFIVAVERLESLRQVIGEVEILGEIQGSDLSGASYQPLFSSLTREAPSQSLPVILSTHVTNESGTGLVHCAPAHGGEDYNVFRSLGLISSQNSIVCHVGADGAFTKKVVDAVGSEAGQRLIGKAVLDEGSRAVSELLIDMGVLVKRQRIKHRYPYDWKTDKPIIVTATSQWFANLDNIKDDAIAAIQSVQFYPDISRNRLESFIKGRSEWCISRQRVWGVPILYLYHPATDRALLDSDTLNHILPILQEKGVAHWWTGPVEDFLPPALHREGGWQKGTDTMDVWFDSGSSWALLEERSAGLPRADVCLEGSDQHRGWFQSQLLTAVGSASTAEPAKAPYGALLTHGMVLDKDGKKMSKSLGNIISPMTILKGGKDKKKEPAYGADVLRLWAATVEYWRDMSLGPKILAQTAESLRKIRNSARFILGNIGSSPPHAAVPADQLTIADKYVMHHLYELEQNALDGYATYNFPKVVNGLTNFTNTTLAAYFDMNKDNLYANDVDSLSRRATVTVLQHVLDTIVHVMAPILPHLAEEVHAARAGNDLATGPSVFSEVWTPLGPQWRNPMVEEEFFALHGVRSAVLSLLEDARTAKQLSSSLEAEVDIILPSEAAGRLSNLLIREEQFIRTLLIVSDATVVDGDGALASMSPAWCYTGSVSVPGWDDEVGIRVRPAAQEKCPRCWTYNRPEEDILCQRCAEVVPHIS